MILIKKLKRILYRARFVLKLEFSNYLLLPLGENCTADVILRRHRLLSFSTFFSDAWSNIDHVIEVDRIGLAECFKRENLEYEPTKKAFIFSKIIAEKNKIFNLPTGANLAFPHFDLLKDNQACEKLIARQRRFDRYKGRKSLVFFYYHIKGVRTDLELLFDRLHSYGAQFRTGSKFCKFVVFSYCLVHSPKERRIKFSQKGRDILYFDIFTMQSWQDTFYGAEHDDDLVKEMLKVMEFNLGNQMCLNPFAHFYRSVILKSSHSPS